MISFLSRRRSAHGVRESEKRWRIVLTALLAVALSQFSHRAAVAQDAVLLNPSGAPGTRAMLVSTRLTEDADAFLHQLDPKVGRVPLISNEFIDPDQDLVPNYDVLLQELNNEVPADYAGVIVLNWEGPFFGTLRDGPANPDFEVVMQRGIDVVNYVKSVRPNALVGYYAFPSGKWVGADHEALQPLYDAVSVLLPGGAIGQSDPNKYPSMVNKLKKNVEFCLELAGDRPVLAFHSPRFTHSGLDHVGVELLESHIAKTFDYEYNGKRAAGVIIWDPTMRMYYQNELAIFDAEYIPADMPLWDYIGAFQRTFICAATKGVIPGFACSESIDAPGEGGGEGGDGDVAPAQSGGAAGVAGENGNDGGGGGSTIDWLADGNQQRRIIIIDTGSNDGGMPGMISGAGGAQDKFGAAMGVDLAPLDPAISGWSFTNLLWTSAPWQLLDGNNQVVASEPGAMGYPVPAVGQSAVAVIGAEMQSTLPPGRWFCMYDGQGDLEFAGDAVFLRQQQDKWLIRVTPSSAGVVLKMKNVSMNNPVRNVRMVPFSARRGSDTEPTHAGLISRLLPGHPTVLRFASWQKIDGSPLVNWSERAKVEHVSQRSDRGAAYELMFDLCDELGSESWMCIPHQATDDYVREFARLAKIMSGNKRVFVEYSSGVLNPDSAQYAYAAEQGAALELGNTPDEAAARYYAQRSREIFAIWRDEFGNQQDRVVRVLSVPGGESALAALVLNRADAINDADYINVEAGIGGASVMPAMEQHGSGLSVDQGVNLLSQSRDERMASFESVAAMVAAAQKPMSVTGVGAGLLVNADGLGRALITQLRKIENDPRVISMNRNEVAFWGEQGAVLILTSDRPLESP